MATLAELLKTGNSELSEKAGAVVKEKQRQEAALRIYLSKDGRKGKTVTVITGFTHGDNRKEDLATRLKKSCGVGGRVINATIELQGNVIPAATKLLTARVGLSNLPDHSGVNIQEGKSGPPVSVTSCVIKISSREFISSPVSGIQDVEFWLELLPYPAVTLANEGCIALKMERNSILSWQKVDDILHLHIIKNMPDPINVFNHLSIGIIVVDSLYRITDCNDSACQILGRSREQIVGQLTTDERWGLLDETGAKCPVADYPVNISIRDKKQVLEVILSIPNPETGKQTWLQINSEPESDTEGNLHRVICTFDDVTRIRQAEQTIRLNEERYRMLIDQSGQVLYDYLLETGSISWSGAIETITGYPPEEFGQVTSDDWAAMIHPDDQEMTSTVLYDSMKEGSRYHLEYRFRRKSGDYIYVEDNGIFIRDPDGEVIRLLGTLRDVSERRSAMESIRDNEERFRSLIESARDVIFTLAPNGSITSLNTIFETVTGWERQEWIGKPFTNIIHPDDLPEVMQLFTEVLHGTTNVFTEKRIRMRTGDYASCEVTVMPQMMRNQVVGILGFIRDITHKKKMEDHLRQAQKMDSIGTLAGGIAHDFNNLLNIMVGNLHLLNQDTGLTDKGRKRLESIQKAADRGTGLVRQLLTFAKKSDLLLEPINLHLIIQDLVKLLEETFPKNITINLNLINDIPILLADANQLHQVFLNLCVNARDAMPDGGELTLGSRLVNKQMVEGKDLSLNHDRYIEISVSDTGTGMDDATKQRIFEPFFTTKGSGKGTGLGLSVVFGIIQNHRGHVSVVSNPGEGTRFNVYFPVPETLPEAEGADDSVSEDTPGGTETILLVEDEWMIREIIASMLEEKGYTVYQAEDGLAAVDIFTKHHATIDLLVTDLEMPRLGGRDAYMQMKSIKSRQPAIVVSGFINPELRTELTKAGVKALIHKPFRPDNLLKIIRRILDAVG